MNEQKLLRLSEVMKIVGLKKTNIYEKMRNGTFPPAYKTGKRAVAWKNKDILQWMESLPQVSHSHRKDS